MRALRVEYHPNAVNATQAAPILYSPVYTVIDRDDASNVGAVTNIVSNQSMQIFALDQQWVRETRAQSIGENDFNPVSADPTRYFVVKAFSTGLSVTSTYGVFLVRWVCEFRTRD